ncbi:hypothetical protein KKF34_10605 [Myxococcota bacterium]|nr:hypothetical protein [Myxococcota bacterium]MBU1380167.1 hypothetical protein [Myxococcota bacterium]MBU1497317.1 hypothetical protein [Myxococcota bacterium]
MLYKNILFLLFITMLTIACSGKRKNQSKNSVDYTSIQSLSAAHRHLTTKDSSNSSCELANLITGWLILASADNSPALMDELFRVTGSGCVKTIKTSGCIKDLYNYINSLADRCSKIDESRGEDIKTFSIWYSRMRQKWDVEFFKTTEKLLKSSLRVHTALVMIASIEHAARITKAMPHAERLNSFIRMAGFQCPSSAGVWDFSPGGIFTDFKGDISGCIPHCSEISRELFSYPRRRREFISKCSYTEIPLAKFEDMKYIAPDNWLFFKSLHYANKILTIMEKSKDPLAFAGSRLIKKANDTLKDMKVTLSFQTGDEKEPDTATVPLSPAALTVPVSTFFIHVNSSGNLSYGLRPVFTVKDRKIIGDYPGKTISRNLEEGVSSFLYHQNLKSSPVLMLDENIKSDVLVNILKIMKKSGISTVEIGLRNTSHMVRTFLGNLTEHRNPEKELLITVAPGLISVTSEHPQVKDIPFKTQSTFDFSSLRVYLEKLKWKKKISLPVIIKLEPGVKWKTAGRIIGYIYTNTSGRKLFENITFLIKPLSE